MKAEVVNCNLGIVIAALQQVTVSDDASDGDRFYAAARLRRLRTELSALIKALEVAGQPARPLGGSK